MEVLVIISIIMAYAVAGGASFSFIQSSFRPACKYYKTGNCDEFCGHSVVAGLSTLFWPIVLPMTLGIKVGSVLGPSGRQTKQEKEIEAAEHKVKLAELRAREIAASENAAGIRY